MRGSPWPTLAIIAACAFFAACNDGASPAAPTSRPSPAATATATEDPSNLGASDRVTLSGLLLDHPFPLQADFLGAVVRRSDGLVSPCQAEIPEVVDGRYEIAVMAQSEAAGCGAPGTEVILWTYIDDVNVYSVESFTWPGDGASAEFNATFRSNDPQGAAPVVTGFSGEAISTSGGSVAPGTLVEAYIADTLCGVGSTRYGEDFSGYILSVIADDSVTGCTAGATITFRVAGQPAQETATNAKDPTIRGGEFTLTIP